MSLSVMATVPLHWITSALPLSLIHILTNTRASGSDDALRLIPISKLSLEGCLEFLAQDELLEVTPENLRIRKQILNHEQRMNCLLYTSHKRGAEVFSDIADYCDELGVSSVYFYAFSTENWKRPLEEVNAIMRLFGEYLPAVSYTHLDVYKRQAQRRVRALGR